MPKKTISVRVDEELYAKVQAIFASKTEKEKNWYGERTRDYTNKLTGKYSEIKRKPSVGDLLEIAMREFITEINARDFLQENKNRKSKEARQEEEFKRILNR